MIVEVAVVADYANMADGEKLNVMGMFDRIWATAFPAAHPSMVLAFRLRFDFDDRNKAHTMEIGLFDEDGHQFGGGSGAIEVGSIPAGQRQVISQILPFVGITFPHPGDYHFVLRWNGEEKARVPLTVAVRPTPPTAA